MANIIAVVVLAAIIGLAARYVIKAKKSGKKCIGCPGSGCNCSSGKNSDCSRECPSCRNH